MKRWINIPLFLLILISLTACEFNRLPNLARTPKWEPPPHEPKELVVRFSKVDDVDIPPYEGEVQVFTQSDNPSRNSIQVGSVYVAEKMSREEILAIMKEEAATNGADTIVLFYDEPEIKRSGDLFWGASAFRTQGVDGLTQ